MGWKAKEREVALEVIDAAMWAKWARRVYWEELNFTRG